MIAFMLDRKLALVGIDRNGPPSGGNVFNAALLEQAARSGWPLHGLAQPSDARMQSWDLLVWDSLLLERVQRTGRERIGLLLHYLPSLEPCLASSQAAGLRAIEDRAAAVADFCIVASAELEAQAAKRWPGLRRFVCEPGVGALFRRRASHVASTRAMLLTVANLLPAKGHARLLEALATLRERQWRWHIVGDDANGMAERLRTRARALDLTDRIVLHGALPQSQVAALMTAADLLLHPSRFESYGMVLAEAAAVGLPAVAFRVGAAQRLVAHGRSGYLAEPGDWDAYLRHLAALLDDLRARERFERNLAAVAVRGWDRTCADFRAACAAILR